MRHAGRIIGIVTAAAALTLTGCGGGGSEGRRAGAPEQAQLRVGVLPVHDVAPLYIAIEKGYFKTEGLTVTPEVMAHGTAGGLTELAGGGLDVILGNYMTVFTAAEKGAGDYAFIADCYQAGANGFNIVVKGDSPMDTPADLKGTTVAVNAVDDIGGLALVHTLTDHGLPREAVEFVEIPFPEMAAAIAAGRADAAWMTEPYLTYAQRQDGARTVLDTMAGDMKDFPVAGWTTTRAFTQDSPNAVAAFQRALGRAQAEAAADREEVRKVIPMYTRIDARTAAEISLGTYPTSMDATRLQRVPDLMLRLGFLKTKVDVAPMIAGPAR
ncbi:ABC transporter substrate-binding protein [Nonomuraea sp. MTCD27]|uniref:ABC transporter substrate-binding protein n=1 Tax=Nonomuraea sp. MTCD27 TaxID=1676747 RepID=UPI0035C1D174